MRSGTFGLDKPCLWCLVLNVKLLSILTLYDAKGQNLAPAAVTIQSQVESLVIH